MHSRLGSMTVAAGFPEGKQPELPMGEIPLGQYSCKNVFKKKKKGERGRSTVYRCMMSVLGASCESILSCFQDL